jgi:serine/threonine protein kinase
MSAGRPATLRQSKFSNYVPDLTSANRDARVAEWKPNGRAVDMFSLGCVLLEILSLHRRGSLDLLKEHREVDPAFHANISHLTTWLQTNRHDFSRREHYLECEIHLLLSRDPKHRSTAIELLRNIVAHDSYHSDGSTVSMFGHCCRRILIPQKLFKKTKDDAAKTTLQVEKLKDQLRINSINQAECEQRLKQWQKRYIWEQGRKEAETVEKKRMSEDHEMQLKAYDEAYRELELQKEEAITNLREAENTIHEGMKLHYRLEGQLHESQRACQMLEEELVALRTQFATIPRDELQATSRPPRRLYKRFLRPGQAYRPTANYCWYQLL